MGIRIESSVGGWVVKASLSIFIYRTMNNEAILLCMYVVTFARSDGLVCRRCRLDYLLVCMIV